MTSPSSCISISTRPRGRLQLARPAGGDGFGAHARVTTQKRRKPGGVAGIRGGIRRGGCGERCIGNVDRGAELVRAGTARRILIGAAQCRLILGGTQSGGDLEPQGRQPLFFERRVKGGT